MKLRIQLHKSGFRYRIHYPITGKPDIVFPKKRIAIFIHGCFWHQHGCNNSVIPKTNTNFWKEKLNKNILRDKEVVLKLKKERWISKIVWECEIEDKLKKTFDDLAGFLHHSQSARV